MPGGTAVCVGGAEAVGAIAACARAPISGRGVVRMRAAEARGSGAGAVAYGSSSVLGAAEPRVASA